MTELVANENLLQPFLFDQFPVRGALVRIDAELAPLLATQPKVDSARAVLAESAVASLLIANAMKFTGRLTLQWAGSGPLSVLIAQSTNDLRFRGTVMLRQAADGQVSHDTAFADLIGAARCNVIINSADERERYQGIVEVEGQTLADSLSVFFERSVQLPSVLVLGADAGVAGGLLLQILGGEKDFAASDDWHRLGLMARTLTVADLHGNDCFNLLRKLFAEDDLRLLDARPVHWGCECSRTKSLDAIRTLGEADALQAIGEQGGTLTVTCEYCGRARDFDVVDVQGAFAEPQEPPPADLH